MERQGADELAFNNVFIRQEVSLMDTCEVFDMTVIFLISRRSCKFLQSYHSHIDATSASL